MQGAKRPVLRQPLMFAVSRSAALRNTGRTTAPSIPLAYRPRKICHSARSKTDNGYVANAQDATAAVTTDLERLCRTVEKPVLLSIRLDGFTCNADLMNIWLRNRSQNFIFVATLEDDTAMDVSQFIKVDNSYIGTWDSKILLDHMKNPVQQPARYDALLEFWVGQQGSQDAWSRYIRARNSAPR